MSSYGYRLGEGLVAILEKASKKDKRLSEATMKKMKDIAEHPHHFKPLRHDFKGRRRVHIEKSFILTFKIDEEDQMVVFLDLRHHDMVYKKR